MKASKLIVHFALFCALLCWNDLEPKADYVVTETEFKTGEFRLTSSFPTTVFERNFNFPGFGILKSPEGVQSFAHKSPVLDVETVKKVATQQSADYYINTCNCPYLLKYDVDTFINQPVLESALKYRSLRAHLLHFLRRSFADFETFKDRFLVGNLKLLTVNEVSVSAADEVKSLGGSVKDDQLLCMNYELRFKSVNGRRLTRDGHLVQVAIMSNRRKVVNGETSREVFDFIVKFYAYNQAESDSGKDVKDACLERLKKPQNYVLLSEGFQVGHNFLANSCSFAKQIANQVVQVAVNSYERTFRTVNFCSQADFIKEVVEKADPMMPDTLLSVYNFHNKLKADKAVDFTKVDGFWFSILQRQRPEWSPVTQWRFVGFPQDKLESYQLETTPVNEKQELRSALEKLNEIHYSEHFQRFTALKSNRNAFSNYELELVNSLSNNVGGTVCQRIQFVLSLSFCPYANESICQNIAYLRTINKLRYVCQEFTDCEQSGSNHFQISVFYGLQKIGWFDFSVTVLVPGGNVETDGADVCYESEFSFIGSADSKMNCWREVKDLSSNSRYLTAFINHFAERCRQFEQTLLSKLTKYEVLEFVFMLFEDYSQNRARETNKESPIVKVRDQLAALWKSHAVRKDLKLQLSDDSVSVQTFLPSNKDVHFWVRVLDKSSQFMTLILETPSKREEVHINRDINARFGIPLYHQGSREAKEEKFGRLFAHFGLQIYDFVNAILPPVHKEGDSLATNFKIENPSCFRFLEDNFQSDNLQFSTLMSFVQLSLSKNGYFRILDKKPSFDPEKDTDYFKLNPDCEEKTMFALVKEGESVKKLENMYDIGVTDIDKENTDPLLNWLFYSKQSDYEEDRNFIDFDPGFQSSEAYPEPTVSLRELLNYSLNKEFALGTTSVQMFFGHATQKRKLLVEAYLYNHGIMRSVQLILKSGYFDQESVIMLSVFSETRDHVYSTIQQFVAKNKQMAEGSKNVGKRQGYTVPIVQKEIESIITAQSQLTFCVAASAEMAVFSIIPKQERRMRQFFKADNGFELPAVLTRTSMESSVERQLGTVVPDCGEATVYQNIVVKYATKEKREIVISVTRTEKKEEGGKVEIPFSDSYTIQALYPFEHKPMLQSHLREMIKKLE